MPAHGPAPGEMDCLQAKQDLEDTRNSLSADQKFLMNLKETCQMTDAESGSLNSLKMTEILDIAEIRGSSFLQIANSEISKSSAVQTR